MKTEVEPIIGRANSFRPAGNEPFWVSGVSDLGSASLALPSALARSRTAGDLAGRVAKRQ